MVVKERKPETKFEMNLVRLVELYHSEDACREYLEHLRWPNGLACLRCGSTIQEARERASRIRTAVYQAYLLVDQSYREPDW